MRAVHILPAHGFLDQDSGAPSEVFFQVVIHVFARLLVTHTPTIYTVKVAEQYGINEELFNTHHVAVDGVNVVHEFQSLEHVSIVVEAEKWVEGRSAEDNHEEGHEEGMEAAMEASIEVIRWRDLCWANNLIWVDGGVPREEEGFIWAHGSLRALCEKRGHTKIEHKSVYNQSILESKESSVCKPIN